MDKRHPFTVVCTYRVKPGKEKAMQRLLAKHWSILHELGLVTDDPPIRLRGLPDQAGPFRPGVDERTFVEIFAWKGENASELAHRRPEVLSVWEPMSVCCESMEFPTFAPLEVD